MLTLRYLIRFLKEFIIRFRGIILLGTLVGILVFIFFYLFGKTLFLKKVERVGITGRYSLETIPSNILSLASYGLTKVNEDGSVGEGLASSWETTDKGKTWIFHLNGNLSWQDGKKVNSSDISYKFSDAKIIKPDRETIIFTLENPFAPFPYVVSQPVFKKGLLGVGEWKVNSLSLSGSFIKELTLTNKNKDQKIYKFYPTEERVKLAFKLGEVDRLENVFNPDPFLNWKNLVISKETNYQEVVAVFFNTQDSLFKDNKSLRQASAYAIKKEDLPGERAYSPISPTSWVYNAQVKPYNYDFARAQELMKDLPKEVKNNLVINLTTSAILLDTAEKIAKDWEALGVKVNLQVVSGIPSDYQAFLAIMDIPKDPDQYTLWHSTQQASNISRYQNPRIDKLLEDGRLELDTEARKKIYLDFQRFLVEDSPAIFLYHPTSYTIERR